jgi:hypothetical protein
MEKNWDHQECWDWGVLSPSFSCIYTHAAASVNDIDIRGKALLGRWISHFRWVTLWSACSSQMALIEGHGKSSNWSGIWFLLPVFVCWCTQFCQCWEVGSSAPLWKQFTGLCGHIVYQSSQDWR